MYFRELVHICLVRGKGTDVGAPALPARLGTIPHDKPRGCSLYSQYCAKIIVRVSLKSSILNIKEINNH